MPRRKYEVDNPPASGRLTLSARFDDDRQTYAEFMADAKRMFRTPAAHLKCVVTEHVSLVRDLAKTGEDK